MSDAFDRAYSQNISKGWCTRKWPKVSGSSSMHGDVQFRYSVQPRQDLAPRFASGLWDNIIFNCVNAAAAGPTWSFVREPQPA